MRISTYELDLNDEDGLKECEGLLRRERVPKRGILGKLGFTELKNVKCQKIATHGETWGIHTHYLCKDCLVNQ